MPSQPTTQQKARFVTDLQHLLAEGEFVSTYKFALLISLARWAVENRDHDERVPLDVRALAPHFVELYWPQVRPFHPGEAPAARGVAEGPHPRYGSGRVEPDREVWDLVLQQERAGQRPRVLDRILGEQHDGAALPRDVPAARRARLFATRSTPSRPR